VLFCIRTTRLLLSGSEIYSETHYLSDPLYHAFVRFSMCPERCFSHSDGSFQPPHFHPLNVLEVYPSSLKLLPPIPLATLLCLYIYIYIYTICTPSYTHSDFPTRVNLHINCRIPENVSIIRWLCVLTNSRHVRRFESFIEKNEYKLYLPSSQPKISV